MKDIAYESLVPLLQVHKKEDIETICKWASCEDKKFQDAVGKVSQILFVDENCAENLLKVIQLIQQRSKNATVTPTQFHSLFPDNFPREFSTALQQCMKTLSIKIPPTIQSNFLPKLTDFDWQVRVKTSNSLAQATSIPICILQIRVQTPVISKFEAPRISNCVMELSKESIDTVLGELRKIHDILSNIAK